MQNTVFSNSVRTAAATTVVPVTPHTHTHTRHRLSAFQLPLLRLLLLLAGAGCSKGKHSLLACLPACLSDRVTAFPLARLLARKTTRRRPIRHTDRLEGKLHRESSAATRCSALLEKHKNVVDTVCEPAASPVVVCFLPCDLHHIPAPSRWLTIHYCIELYILPAQLDFEPFLDDLLVFVSLQN